MQVVVDDRRSEEVKALVSDGQSDRTHLKLTAAISFSAENVGAGAGPPIVTCVHTDVIQAGSRSQLDVRREDWGTACGQTA